MIETYSIQEASQMAEVSAHTLRFWEKTLSGVIVPLRTKGGQRRYTRHHLQIIADIKKMKKTGLSLRDINAKILDNNSQAGEGERVDKIDSLVNQIAEVVKSSIYDFLAKDEQK